MKYKADLKDWIGYVHVSGIGSFLTSSREAVNMSTNFDHCAGNYQHATEPRFVFLKGGRFINAAECPRYLFSDQPFTLDGRKVQDVS